MKKKDQILLEEAYIQVNELKASTMLIGYDKNGKKIFKGTKVKNLENGKVGIVNSWFIIDGKTWLNYDTVQGDKKVRIRDYFKNFEVIE